MKVNEIKVYEMEHPPYSPDLAPNDIWLFPKIESALKGRRFQDTEDIKKNVTIPLKVNPQPEFHLFCPTVSASLV
jgi:histone-lysine N-methyltransferase SETMAR